MTLKEIVYAIVLMILGAITLVAVVSWSHIRHEKKQKAKTIYGRLLSLREKRGIKDCTTPYVTLDEFRVLYGTSLGRAPQIVELFLQAGWLECVGEADGEYYYRFTDFAAECAHSKELKDWVMERIREE